VPFAATVLAICSTLCSTDANRLVCWSTFANAVTEVINAVAAVSTAITV
jgi:hypothetical protein